jgi:hypothetical protein
MRKFIPTSIRKEQEITSGEAVEPKSTTAGFASLFGSVPALPNESTDLEREIDEAMAEEANRIVGLSARP